MEEWLKFHDNQNKMIKSINTSILKLGRQLENLWGRGGRAKYKKNIRAREN